MRGNEPNKNEKNRGKGTRLGQIPGSKKKKSTMGIEPMTFGNQRNRKPMR